MTTKRYTQAEIEQTAASDDYITLYGKPQDRFGDNGVVSIAIGTIKGAECYIILWLMSCRVLKRDMEFAMMDTLVKRRIERNIHKVIGYYYPTKKNHMVENFYELQGFAKTFTDEDGSTTWELDFEKGYENKNNHIKVEN